MMRPIEELLAYYTFIQLNGRRKRRPKLSEEAKAIALSFEKIMRKPDYFQILAERFENDFSVDELNALIEVYQQSVFEKSALLENKLMVPLDMDLAFEKHVASFTRMQERERMRKRFKGLEEEELVYSNNLVDSMHENIPNLSQKEKAEWPVFLQVVFGMLLFFLLLMILKFLLGF